MFGPHQGDLQKKNLTEAEAKTAHLHVMQN